MVISVCGSTFSFFESLNFSVSVSRGEWKEEREKYRRKRVKGRGYSTGHSDGNSGEPLTGMCKNFSWVVL